MRLSVLTLLLVFLVPDPVLAWTWTVEKDGSGEFTVIQDALDVAAVGDTVLIGEGTYDETVRIRRIERKMGLHGSPTCEIQFCDTPARLIGKRRFGLIRYAMAMMNGARLAVASQAVGIAEAAYRRLRPGGRLVVNTTSIDHVAELRGAMRHHSSEVRVWLVNFSRGTDQLGRLTFQPIRPCFLLAVTKA